MLLATIEPYAAIAATIALVLVIAVGTLIAAHVVGPRRHGPVKDSPYESGVPLVMDTQRRFNVRFYIVAVLFLLFDVEVVFLWPWAQVFHQSATEGGVIPLEGGGAAGKGFLLIGMGIFFGLLVFGLLYEWKKGAFRWD
jgi:NADH-quinone oxidoreductase subunit A